MPAMFDFTSDQPTTLPFPPVTKAHILNCSNHSWHPKYRAITPKSRIIPLPQPFVDYLRADGIVLPSDDERPPEWSDTDSGVFSASDNPDAVINDDWDQGEDVAERWRDVHEEIKRVIAELGGKIVPKLNWSAPKDATWINSNSMECRSPSDVYLLLKSSDFITHDLEHAFEDCVDSPLCAMLPSEIPHNLVLRKNVNFNPSVEFRCFVRRRKLLSICQRDLNHFDFLLSMQDDLRSVIQEFFDVRLRDTFPDECFVFDVYVPAPHTKVWLVDINPWAPRTDPLLFSWTEILTMPDPPELESGDFDVGFARLSIREREASTRKMGTGQIDGDYGSVSETEDDGDVDEKSWLPELRLIKRTDPEAYIFNSPQYSAHKLPKDVVDASYSGEGLREFAREWRDILAKRQKEEEIADSSEDD